MTLAKALAGGLPAGAMLARKHVAASFTPGTHASTFGGNPVAMAAGVAVMKTLLQGDVINNCRTMGSYFLSGLKALQKKFPAIVKDVRGKGLIIGMELNREGKEIVKQCLSRGIIINCTMDRILRFVPPLIITRREIDRCLSVLENIFSKL
jgi:acetylornithine/N-succinyldiaminopimelate aminotransferase